MKMCNNLNNERITKSLEIVHEQNRECDMIQIRYVSLIV